MNGRGKFVLLALAACMLGILLLNEVPVGQRASTSVTACSETDANQYMCQETRYTNLVRDAGVAAAFAKLKVEYRASRFLRSVCHSLAHAIGRVAADLYATVSSAFAHGEHFCRGYYHGVIERTVAKLGPHRVREDASIFCAELRSSQAHSILHLDCAHGVGHGLMAVYRNNLLTALEGCDKLADPWERNHCYSGAFMENRMASQIHPTKFLRRDQPLYPCPVIARRYKPECYRAQISYALRRLSNNFAAAFELCAKAEEIARTACYRGLGAEAFREGQRESVTDGGAAGLTYALCSLGEEQDARAHCIQAAVKNFISYELHGRHDLESVAAFCVAGDSARMRCSQAAAQFFKTLGPGSARGWDEGELPARGTA